MLLTLVNALLVIGWTVLAVTATAVVIAIFKQPRR